MTKVPCGFSDVASPDFYQEEGYGALGLSLAVSRSLSLSPSLFRSLSPALSLCQVSGSGLVNDKSTLNRDESFLDFLHFTFCNRIYMNSFMKQNGLGFSRRLRFLVQKFPIFAAAQVSTLSLPI